jgi:hypothetical protein
VTFDVATSNGSAVAPDDYIELARSRTISAGDTDVVVNVEVVGNLRFELDKTFFVILDNVTNATPGNSVATVTIVDDDPQRVISDVPIEPGNNLRTQLR